MISQTQKLRGRFREQIRQRHINELMKARRASLLNSNSGSQIFHQLNQHVQSAIDQKISMTLVNRLCSLLDSDCENQNTYILIGNYLIDHPGASKYFSMKLLGLSQIGRTKTNYKWVLMLILLKDQELDESVLNQFDLTIADIVEGAESEQEFRQCLEIVKFILGLENKGRQIRFLPKNTLKALNIRLLNVQFADLQYDVKYYLVQIGYYLGQNQLENHFITYIFTLYIKLIILSISEFPSFRVSAINSIKQLSINYSHELQEQSCGKQGKKLFQQLFYLLRGSRTHRLVILQIFQCLLRQFSLDSILNLLNTGIHICLVQTLKQDPSTDEIYSHLKVFNILLNRLKDKGEDHLLEQVLNSMEQNGFQNFLENLASTRHQQKVQKVLSDLLDDFYSQNV